MLSKDRIKQWKLHPSQRGQFSFELYKAMSKNDKIVLVLADLGFLQFDAHVEDFPDRVINCGAAEQAATGIAIGLAIKGKIPFIYTITNFVLYRNFEWVRNYIDHESIPVKLVGAGRDNDYDVDSYTHASVDAKYFLDGFPNIVQFWPTSNEEVTSAVEEMVKNDKASFLSVTRK